MIHRVLHQSNYNGSMIELRECLDPTYERCLQVVIYDEKKSVERYISDAEWHALIAGLVKEGSAFQYHKEEEIA